MKPHEAIDQSLTIATRAYTESVEKTRQMFLAILGHDLLFVDPRGTFSVARADEAVGLVLLLFTALVTAQLADAARRGAETAREAAVARRSDALKTRFRSEIEAKWEELKKK